MKKFPLRAVETEMESAKVAVQKARVIAVESIKDAKKCADRGNIDHAKATIHKTINELTRLQIKLDEQAGGATNNDIGAAPGAQQHARPGVGFRYNPVASRHSVLAAPRTSPHGDALTALLNDLQTCQEGFASVRSAAEYRSSAGRSEMVSIQSSMGAHPWRTVVLRFLPPHPSWSHLHASFHVSPDVSLTHL